MILIVAEFVVFNYFISSFILKSIAFLFWLPRQNILPILQWKPFDDCFNVCC